MKFGRGEAPRSGGLFGEAPPERKPVAAYQANVDGGSRGNPGPAAYGVVIRDPKGDVVARLKKYIGQNTNNVAEYFGLIAALDYAQTHGIRALRVESDSELMVKQMRGIYKVKSGDLQPLHERTRREAGGEREYLAFCGSLQRRLSAARRSLGSPGRHRGGNYSASAEIIALRPRWPAAARKAT